eukprot:3310231-Rhodomonas_salina.1
MCIRDSSHHATVNTETHRDTETHRSARRLSAAKIHKQQPPPPPKKKKNKEKNRRERGGVRPERRAPGGAGRALPAGPPPAPPAPAGTSLPNPQYKRTVPPATPATPVFVRAGRGSYA